MPAILDVMRLMLERAGYEVAVRAEPPNILELKKDGLPDLILLDVLLAAGKDGRDVAKRLKSTAETKHIPIVLVSAHASAVSSLRECGADDFLPKPFAMKDLLNKVAAHVLT